MSMRAEIAWARKKRRVYDLGQMLYIRAMERSMKRYAQQAMKFCRFEKRNAK